MLESRSTPQGTQDALTEQVGLKGVIELAVLCGFYQAIAAVIFAFEVPFPEGVHESFDPGGG